MIAGEGISSATEEMASIATRRGPVIVQQRGCTWFVRPESTAAGEKESFLGQGDTRRAALTTALGLETGVGAEAQLSGRDLREEAADFEERSRAIWDAAQEKRRGGRNF
jgi:hypothetical protein